MNKNILFISYHFPPDAAVGTLRTQKFVKYLPEHGWKPFVLTVKERYYPSRDEERLNDVQDALVERTLFWRTPLQVLIDLRDRIRAGKATPGAPASPVVGKPAKHGPPKCKGLKRWLVSLNWFPDDKLYWLFPALPKGLSLIRTHDIRNIVVSAPPNSSILLAYLLSRLTGAKLVIDYRDPWLLQYEPSQQAFHPKLILDFQRTLQVRMLRHASAVVTTNEAFRSALLGEHAFLSPGKVHVVHNGYDSEDFPSNFQRNEGDKFSISYLGTFYMQRNPANFLQGLALFMREKGLSSADVEVRFVGDTEHAVGSPVRTMIESCGLRDVVTLTGKVKYARALQIMCESSVLLLLAPNQPYQIPAKTYEYMAAGQPILALAQDGATASLIGSMGCGIAVDPNDVEGIRNALVRLYEDFTGRGRGFVCNAGVFERRNQSALLANILERINA
ncbi:MAG: glycosyltransferase family 4 protein [Desulfovibrionales bacterium]|nr:glycosyltransferase family 4 protein [Desulfovibrionales bacterium]